MPQPNVAVISPIYRPKPSALEDIGLRRRAEVLGGYPTFWIAPDTLDLAEYRKYGEAETIALPPVWFESTAQYSRLMLQESFYARFAAYDFVLVYQPDCFVFEDALASFCESGYHYFGAPFPEGHAWPTYGFKGIPFVVNRFPGLLTKKRVFVGNGGLSLRHVQATRDLLRADAFASRTYVGQEDLYFSTRVRTRFRDRFRVCDLDTAYRFAFEVEPRAGYARTGHLPFGTHAWPKHDPEFWRPFLAERGYEF